MKGELSRRIWFSEYEPETGEPDSIEHVAPPLSETDSALAYLLKQIRTHGVIKGRLL